MVPRLTQPFAGLLPPLSQEEFAALRADIREHGIRDPVLVDEVGQVLDGRHRLAIDRNAPRKVIRGLATEAQKQAFVFRCNFTRRNLSPEQKGEARAKMQAIAAELRGEDPKRWTQKALARMFGVGRQTVSDWFTSNAGSGNASKPVPDARVSVPRERRAEVRERVEAGESQAQIAADLGVSQQRVSQIATQERAREEQDREVEAITQQAVGEEFDTLYDVIVVDPPWPMEKIARDVRPRQAGFDYPTMDEDAIAALMIPAAAHCHLWLWTTQRFLPMAFRILDAWGFAYVCAFVWHKPGGYQPIGLPQYNCEFALYARRGSPTFTTTTAFSTAFDAPRGEHSAKPNEFYELVARVTEGRRLDMFNRRAISGFTGWGQEAVHG